MEIQSDVHCVTRWSRLDTRGAGSGLATSWPRRYPARAARFVMVHAEPDYTTNLPLEALLDADVVLATHHDGLPRAAKHGGPVRLVVPRLYFWKSAKWVTGFELMDATAPGSGRATATTCGADPWREERFAGQPRETMQAARARKARE